MVLSWSLQHAERPRTSGKAQYDFRLDEQDWDKVCWGRLPKGEARSLTHQLSRRAKWVEVMRWATTPAGGSWTPDFSPADMTPGRLQALAQVIDQEFFQGTFHRTLRRHSGRQVLYGSANLDELYGNAVQPLGDAVMASTGRRGLAPSLVVVRPTRPSTAPDNVDASKNAPLDAPVAAAPVTASPSGSFRTATIDAAIAEVAEARGQGDMNAGAGGGRGSGDGGRNTNATRSGTGAGGRWSWLRSLGRLGQRHLRRRQGGGGNAGDCGTTCGGAAGCGRAAGSGEMAAVLEGPSATYTHSKGTVVFWREVWGSVLPSVGRPVRLDGVACTSRLCWLAHTLGHEMLHVLLFNMCAPHARDAPQNLSLEGHGYNFLMLNWYVLGHRGHTYDPKGWRLPPPLPCRL